MKNVFQHIEHVKGKPHHIRKQVAFGAATFGTAVIALVWLSTSIGTGVFALKTTPFGQTGEEGVIVSGDTSSENVAGAAAALRADAPAHIEIVDTASSTPLGKGAEQTTLPF